MQSLLRSTTRLAKPCPSTPFLVRTTRTARPYAHQSYGGEEMTGHPKSDQPNPKAHLEHPGPDSPATKRGSPPEDTSPSSAASSSNTGSEGSKPSHPETSHGGSPAINNPGPAPESANEEVRKHNEEVAKSHDRPVNQIGEDGKVEKL